MIIAWSLYNLTILLGFALYWPWAALKGKQPAGWRARNGHLPEALRARLDGYPVLWVHAVSVGEAQALPPLLRQLKARYPGWRLLITTVTRTGQRIAQSLAGSDDVVAFLPLDLPWTMERFITDVQPKLLLAVETEWWPNCWRALQAHGVPIIVLNGRISPASFLGYRRLRWFFRPLLLGVARFLMQTPQDAERLQALGVSSERIQVTRNLKWDQEPPTSVPTGLRQLTQAFGLQDGGLLLIAGSTHPGEEEPVLRVFQRIARDVPQLRCLLAPRHVERVEEVSQRARKLGLEPVTYSRVTTTGSMARLQSSQVVIVDTIGHLRQLYALATIAYIGGSLVPKGGQNPLEPAQFGKPILSGPHVTNFRAIAQHLNHAGGLRIVADVAELETAIRLLLTSPEVRAQMGEKARAALAAHRGAVVRSLDACAPYLDAAVAGRRPCTVWTRGPRSYHWMRHAMSAAPGNARTQLMRAILAAASRLYGAALAAWDLSYHRGWARVTRVARPVISIGNLTLGGTGKSSCVLWLARELRARGIKPAIVTRGYGRGRSLGDEPTMFLQALEDVPVLVGWDRVRSAQQAIERAKADIILLDDGFQHRRLARDVDVVTVDALHGWGHEDLVPRGWLREPLRALRRAHVVLLTKTNVADGAPERLTMQVRAMHPEIAVAQARHEARGLWNGTARHAATFAELAGQRVAALSSIGDPESFERLLAQQEIAPAIAVRYPDHHCYALADIARLVAALHARQVTCVVTTEKDWVRLQPVAQALGAAPVVWYVLQLAFTVEQSDAVVDRLVRLSRR